MKKHPLKIIVTIILIIVMVKLTNSKGIMNSIIGRTSIDSLYSNEEDIDLIEIDQAQQEKKLKEAYNNCSLKTNERWNRTDSCQTAWDSIICWPETQVNRSMYIPCPIYVNKFNRRYKAVKHCIINESTNQPMWSKTNFSQCLLPSQHLIAELGEKKIMEIHLNNIIPIKMIGYSVSLLSLVMSIFILSRPRLRCPRNYVHINLFVTFCFRVFSVIFVDYLRYDSIAFGMQPKGSNITQYLSANDSDGKFNLCRFSMAIFRYSASVYSVAITTEAIYLMLLLKFPYYSEKKGSRFCIVISWVLPCVWIMPWLFIRIYVESKWCWQMESLWNLLIDAPHTMLTILNVLCAIFVIRTLYSKINKPTISPEKVMKYRRLAKSTLIIIPIFGVHFIIFEWLPYFRVATEDSLIELPLVYMEIIFNGFQGLLASVACCFIQKEAQIEVLVVIYNILKKLKLINKLKCIKLLDPEYIQNLKYSRENRCKSVCSFSEGNKIRRSDSTVDSATDSLHMFVHKPKKENSRIFVRRKSSVVETNWFHKMCCCLFSTQKNDFYQGGHRRSILLSWTDNASLAKNLKRLKNSSTINSFFKKNYSNYSFRPKTTSIASQPQIYSTNDSQNNEDLNVNLLIESEQNHEQKQNDSSRLAINCLIIDEEEIKDLDSIRKNSSIKNLDSETDDSSKRKISFTLDE